MEHLKCIYLFIHFCELTLKCLISPYWSDVRHVVHPVNPQLLFTSLQIRIYYLCSSCLFFWIAPVSCNDHIARRAYILVTWVF